MRILRTLLISLILVSAGAARADETSVAASKHFQRGVDLYGDGDFRGALVEFKRAYALLPRATVLYDIAQTSFQLQDYATALRTFERFLAETGPTASHRAEVETTVETLRGRVGKIAVGVSASRCEVLVDDQGVGKSPLDEPLLVSVGTRKVSVICPDRPTETRRVDVVAGETVRLEIKVGTPLPVAPLVNPVAHLQQGPNTKRSMVLSWTFSAIFAAAFIATGTAALVQSADLDAMKRQYPVDRASLDKRSDVVTGLSISTDVLGVVTLVALGVSTFYTAKHVKSRRSKLAFTGASLTGSF